MHVGQDQKAAKQHTQYAHQSFTHYNSLHEWLAKLDLNLKGQKSLLQSVTKVCNQKEKLPRLHRKHGLQKDHQGLWGSWIFHIGQAICMFCFFCRPSRRSELRATGHGEMKDTIAIPQYFNRRLVIPPRRFLKCHKFYFHGSQQLMYERPYYVCPLHEQRSLDYT